MSATLILVILCVVTGAALILAGMAAKRQEAKKQKQLKIRSLKYKSADISDNLEILQKLNADLEIIKALAQYNLLILRQIPALDPSDNSIHFKIDALSKSINELSEQQNNNQRQYVPPQTDNEVTEYKNSLNGTMAFLQKMCLKNTITSNQLARWKMSLKKLQVSLEIDAHIYQSKEAENSNDTKLAIAHLTRAQAVVKEASLVAKEKTELLRNISSNISRLSKSYRQEQQTDPLKQTNSDNGPAADDSTEAADVKDKEDAHKIAFPDLAISDENKKRANHTRPIPKNKSDEDKNRPHL